MLLSGIAFPTSIPGRIVEAWRHGLLDVVLSPYILAELRRVLPRLSHRHGLSDVDLPALSADWPIVTPAAFWAAHGGPTP